MTETRSVEHRVFVMNHFSILTDPFDAGVPQGERSLCVVGQGFGAFQSDQEAAVLLLVVHRPILIALPLREKHTASASTLVKTAALIPARMPMNIS